MRKGNHERGFTEETVWPPPAFDTGFEMLIRYWTRRREIYVSAHDLLIGFANQCNKLSNLVCMIICVCYTPCEVTQYHKYINKLGVGQPRLLLCKSTSPQFKTSPIGAWQTFYFIRQNEAEDWRTKWLPSTRPHIYPAMPTSTRLLLISCTRSIISVLVQYL